MRVAILDDYQSAVQTLDCFTLLKDHSVQIFHETLAGPDAIAGALEGVDAVVLIRERTRFDAEVISKLPGSIKLISLTGTPSGQIDLQAAWSRGITVCQGGGSGASTSELTWALILAATRHVTVEDRRMREGHWQTTLGRVLKGRTLGILGYGRLGAEVARIGHAFGMKILCFGRDSSRERSTRDGFEFAASQRELFAQSDVLSIHAKLTSSSRHMITREDLASMKPDALLVNTARAGLIEPGALIEALLAGCPGSAALDVFDIEPLPADDPILSLPNVLCTPHLGYTSRDGYETLFGHAFRNILAFAAGQPTGVVPAVRA